MKISPIMMIPLFIFLILVVSAFGMLVFNNQDTGELEARLDSIDRRLVDLNNCLDKLEGEFEAIEAGELTGKGGVPVLQGRLKGLEKKVAELSALPIKTVDAGSTREAPFVQKKVPVRVVEDTEVITKLKDDIMRDVKQELKADEEAKKVEMRKKKAEGTRKWMAADYEGRMKRFPEFAEKIGLDASQEADIKRVSEETFEKIIQVLTEAFEKPEEEVDWVAVKTRMGEIEKEAVERISPQVTEEQGRQLYKFFHGEK